MKKILGLCIALLLVGAVSASATSTQVGEKFLQYNNGASLPGIQFTTPALDSANDAYCIFNVQRLYTVANQADGTFTSSLFWAWNTSTAGDSAQVGVFVGPTSAGPWTTVYALANATTVLKGATPYVGKYDIANTTFLPMPWMKVQLKRTVKPALTAKTVIVVFPSVSQGRYPSTWSVPQ